MQLGTDQHLILGGQGYWKVGTTGSGPNRRVAGPFVYVESK